MSGSPCAKCGRILHTGEGRVLVGFTVLELEELLDATTDTSMRARLLCAMSLLDEERAKALS